MKLIGCCDGATRARVPVEDAEVDVRNLPTDVAIRQRLVQVWRSQNTAVKDGLEKLKRINH
jgi:hypothetical protein